MIDHIQAQKTVKYLTTKCTEEENGTFLFMVASEDETGSDGNAIPFNMTYLT